MVYNLYYTTIIPVKGKMSAGRNRLKAMKVIETKKKKGSLLLRIAVFAFAVYVAVALFNQQLQISEKRQQLAEIKEQIQIQEIKNDDIKHALNSGENENSEYIERVAREGLNFAKPNERVFVNIAGN